MPSTHIDTDPQGNKIVFEEDGHRYYTRVPSLSATDAEAEIAYISTTALIKKYAQPFDPDGSVTAAYAAKHGKTAAEVKAEWAAKSARSCEVGTRVHEVCEDVLLGRDIRNSPRDEHEQKLMYQAYEIASSICGHIRVLGVEKIVFDIHLAVAGTIDFLGIDGGDVVHVCDWKGLPLDTPILTTKGWKTMGTVQVGDCVFDKDGKPTKVMHTSKIHNNPCYKIRFKNGDSIVADHEHRWLISFSGSDDRIMTTEEIARHLDNIKDCRTSYNIPRINNPRPISCECNAKPSLDPYVLGVWLGDGSSACGVITNPNQVIFDEIERRGFKCGPNLSHNGECMMRTVYGLSAKLRELNLIKNKHIPVEYLISDEVTKLDLLAGFMDADGYYNTTRHQCSTSTTREFQRDFVVQLLGSLGIKSSVFEIAKKYKGRKIKSWDICFTPDENPFKMRKVDFRKPTKKCNVSRVITDCSPAPTVQTRCIEVDSPTHTFLAGYNMLVTHNTNERIERENRYNKFMQDGLSHLPDTTFNHYALQLSLYHNILRNRGYIRPETKIVHDIFHIREDGVEHIEIPYLAEEAARILYDRAVAVAAAAPF